MSDRLTPERQAINDGPWIATEFRPGDWRIKVSDGSDGCWWVAEFWHREDAERAAAAVNAHQAQLRRVAEAVREACVQTIKGSNCRVRRCHEVLEEFVNVDAIIRTATEGKP